jgi:hypothetical protein
MTAVQKGQQAVRELYEFICDSEKIEKKPFRFRRISRGGARCDYLGSHVFSIVVDIGGIDFGGTYVLCDVVAHQIEITKNGNATHNAAFKKTFNSLREKYDNC